jgi:hypothetical protein
MAAFIVRVELMGSPTFEVYERLHTLMASAGFTQQPRTDSGATAVLPHATYNGQSTMDCNPLATYLRDRIQREVWTKAKVLSVHYERWSLANPS